MYNIGDTIRYKTLFGWKEAVIIDKRKVTHIEMGLYAYPYTETQYMIRTKNNRIKVLNSEKIF